MSFGTKLLGIAALCCLVFAFASAQNKPQPGAGQGGSGKLSDGQNAPRFDAARFLKDHDTNKDGKLSKDELPAAAQREFDQLDTNKDGFISLEELEQHAARMARQRPQLVEVVYYTIDIPEEHAPTVQELQAAYDQLRKLDKNKDGKIDESELKACREERKKERIDHIFTVLDKNKDGKISKEEARGLWADNFSQLDKNNDGFLDKQEVEAACAMRTEAGIGGIPAKKQDRKPWYVTGAWEDSDRAPADSDFISADPPSLTRPRLRNRPTRLEVTLRRDIE